MKAKRKIRLAIIGCGGFVRYHVNSFKKEIPEFRVVALVDIAPDHAEKLRDDLLADHKPLLFTDYKKMLREVRPEAVIVSTPHTLHFQMCYDAISAGCHVMVEKPMVTNSGDARKLVAHAERNRKVLSVAIQGTHTDTFAYARKLIADGTMGDLQLVTGVLAQGWMKGTRGKWRQDPRLSGGGQLYDSTCHVLSAMMYLVNSPVKEVFCYADNKGCKVDINAVGLIRFANGCMGTITSGGNCRSWKSHVMLQGEDAFMEISAHGGDFRVHGNALKKEIRAVPKGWKVPTISPARNYANCILGKDTPRCGGRVGILMSDLMDALYESAATGKPARVRRKMPKV